MAIDTSRSSAQNSVPISTLQPISASNTLAPFTERLEPLARSEFLQPISFSGNTNKSTLEPPSKLTSIATSFTFQEITGEKRKLTLTGRALPYRPLSLSGTMRAEVTYYPGSPEPTLQMLGSTEEETTITGMWKDRFITLDSGFARLNNTALPDAKSIIDLVDDMRRKGQLIEIAWDEIVRQGYISQFEQTWSNRRDVEWSITFHCINQGDTIPNATVPTISKPDQFAATVQNAAETAAQSFGPDILQKFLTKTRTAKGASGRISERFKQIAVKAAIVPSISKSQLFLQRAKSFSDTFSLEILLARSALDNALNGVNNKAQLVEDVLSRSNAVLQKATSFAIALRNRPLEDYILNAAANSTTVGQVLAIAASTRELNRNMSNLAREMANTRATTKAVKKRDSSPMSAPFVARQGDDLRKVARITMGDSNAWRIIAAYNNLQTSELEPGQRVYIPNRSMVAKGSNPK